MRDLILELFIIGLILLEGIIGFVEGNKQAAILGKLNESAGATAGTLQVLQKAQQDSLNTLNDSLQTIKQQSALIQQQLDIQQSQYQAQNRRPVLKMWAVIYTLIGNKFSTQCLDPAAHGWMAEMNMLVQGNTRYRVAYFVLRNVGTAPAVNFAVLPRPSQGVGVVCVDYPELSLHTKGRPESVQPCPLPSSMLPPIPAQSKDRPAPQGLPGSEGAVYDPYLDVFFEVNLTVPLDISEFDLELWTRADGVNPTRYFVHCHNPQI